MNIDTLCVNCMEDDSGSPVCPKCGAQFQAPHANLLLLPPRTLLHQQYVIGRALGHGGFGVTYLAWDTGLKIRLAIKEYMPSGVAGRSTPNAVHAASERMKDEYEWGLERFLEEARVLKKFSTHPNIVAVDTIFRDNGTAYMVMEFLDGMTFEEFLGKRGGKVNFETALRVMVPVMDTLAVVHGEGILHRDISPDNIHLGKNGKVKLMDFGAARNALSQKSRNLSVILKEGYAPEEQYRSSGIQGPWTDVYATAATLYHSLTGKLPPPALDRAAEDNIENPSKLGVALPPGSERALMKALAVRAMDRYQSMEDFKAGLVENVSLPPPMPAVQPAVATQPPPLAPNPSSVSSHSVNQPAVNQPASNPPPTPRFQSPPSQTYPPPMQESFSVPPGMPPVSKGSSRKWLIPVVVIAVFALAAGAAVTLRYGSDLFSKSSSDKPAPVPEQQAASGASQADEDRQRQLPQKAPSNADAPPPVDAASQPPAQYPESKAPAQPPSAKATPAPPPAAVRPAGPPPVPQPVPMNQPAPPAARPANTNSGVLRYAGPPVPFNGRVTFANLPGARLRFTFDHAAWQPIISRQPDGSQTLVLVSLKQGLQSKCEVQWEKVE